MPLRAAQVEHVTGRPATTGELAQQRLHPLGDPQVLAPRSLGHRRGHTSLKPAVEGDRRLERLVAHEGRRPGSPVASGTPGQAPRCSRPADFACCALSHGAWWDGPGGGRNNSVSGRSGWLMHAVGVC